MSLTDRMIPVVAMPGLSWAEINDWVDTELKCNTISAINQDVKLLLKLIKKFSNKPTRGLSVLNEVT